MYFKINLVFYTPFSEMISSSTVIIVAASLAAVELNSLNNAIFSVINRIRHISKQRADFNRVLNEITESLEIRYRTEKRL